MGSMSAETPGEQSNDYDHHPSIHHGRVLKVYCQDGRWSGRGGLGQRWRKWVSSEKQTDLAGLSTARLHGRTFTCHCCCLCSQLHRFKSCGFSFLSQISHQTAIYIWHVVTAIYNIKIKEQKIKMLCGATEKMHSEVL